MMRRTRPALALFGPLLVLSACRGVLGIEKPMWRRDDGADGGGGSVPGPDAGGRALFRFNQPCTELDSLGCLGSAQRTRLRCDGSRWVANGACDSNQLCDATPGPSAGRCRPVVPECAGHGEGFLFCRNESTRLACGPDLVSTVDAPCGGSTPACDNGSCAECASGSRGCTGSGSPRTCVDGAWAAQPACDPTTQECLEGVGCGPKPHCAGVPDTCGPLGTASCCSSTVVTGGSFYRDLDNQGFAETGFPASVSDFRMDTYEITVGRFRKFVEAYTRDMTAPGAGKNPNDAADPGWDGVWNTLLPADRGALRSALAACVGSGDPQLLAWTEAAGPNEHRPMNCITWYEAFAFCVWDGGRLPTRAESNYAASGGDEQRSYTWSVPPTSDARDETYYATCLHPPAPCMTVNVGSFSPKGDGRWGQADLTGNVAEWNVDYAGAYPVPCVDCANRTPSPNRMTSGASLVDGNVSAAIRSVEDAAARGLVGARCARAVR